eukprot:Lankesteria_metandrocarpae@DN3056_c0_g1_i1.p1
MEMRLDGRGIWTGGKRFESIHDCDLRVKNPVMSAVGVTEVAMLPEKIEWSAPRTRWQSQTDLPTFATKITDVRTFVRGSRDLRQCWRNAIAEAVDGRRTFDSDDEIAEPSLHSADEALEAMVTEVGQSCNVRRGCARYLVEKNNWSAENAIEGYMDRKKRSQQMKYFMLSVMPDGNCKRSLVDGSEAIGALHQRAEELCQGGGVPTGSRSTTLVPFLNGVLLTERHCDTSLEACGLDFDRRNVLQFVYAD